MKLAIICIVGPLDRYGYQNTYAVALESFSAYADVIYLVSSTRNDVNVDKVKTQFPKVVYISNPETWYLLDEHGQEIFDLNQWNTNLDIGFREAIQNGAAVGLWVTINEYIPERAAAKIYTRIEKMLAEKQPFEWTYRRFQLGSFLFEPDMSAPYIINLQSPDPYMARHDWIETPQGEKIHCLWNSAPLEFSDEAIVDCPMEMTLDDLRNKMNFTKSYAQLNSPLPLEFDFEVHVQNYYLPKFLEKEVTKDRLDRFGKIIAQNSRPDYISQYIMKKHRNSWRKIKKFRDEKRAWLDAKISNLLHRLKKATSRI